MKEKVKDLEAKKTSEEDSFVDLFVNLERRVKTMETEIQDLFQRHAELLDRIISLEDHDKGLKTLLPYCIPGQWITSLRLLPQDDWHIPGDAQKILTKLFDTNIPWEKFPAKGARRIWLRGHGTGDFRGHTPR